MSSNFIRALTKEAIIEFESAFSNTKELFWDKENNKLIHPGEFGKYREDIVERFLSLYIPAKYSIGSGFVITNQGDISTQCDIIIYDNQNTPRIENNYNQRFFPVETVVGIGEVKSNIQSEGELNKYLSKLAHIKELREKSKDQVPFTRYFKGDYDPKNNPFDQIFTFLICNKFDFLFNISSSISYDDIEPRFKHNLLLSINNGTLTYKTSSGTKNLYFPIKDDIIHEYHWLKKDEEEISSHMIIFLNSFFTGIKNTTTLDIDMAIYLTDNISDKVI